MAIRFSYAERALNWTFGQHRTTPEKAKGVSEESSDNGKEMDVFVFSISLPKEESHKTPFMWVSLSIRASESDL